MRERHYLTLDLRCSCGASLYVEVPDEPTKYCSDPLPHEVLKLAVAWTRAHEGHHREPASVSP
jgi:hypothetical protein